MCRELEPRTTTCANNLWHDVVEKVDLDLNGVTPIQMVVPEEGIRLGSFYASFVQEDKKLYLQVENFDTPEWAEMFFLTYEAKWKVFPGGIYRVELNPKKMVCEPAF